MQQACIGYVHWLTTAVLQSGMRETDANEVELGDLEGPVLTALISAMYGKLTTIAPAIALPLFRAADAYQVRAHCDT